MPRLSEWLPWGSRANRRPGLGWLRWPGGPLLTGTGFESTRYLTKWLLLGTLIGLVAGVGAIAFSTAIGLATQLCLGRLVGYLPPAPVGEGTPALIPIARPWLLPLVVALGGLISGLIVFTLAPEAEGHGTDAAIAAIHHRRGQIRARIPPIKLIASAITIGSGGSGGREGPSAQISAGFGSLLADWLQLGTQDRRIAVAAGMGAGIGAIFRAPLGGAVMAAEILYLHDLEVEAIIPALIASIVGYSVYGAYFGFVPIFGAQPDLGLDSPVQLLYYAALGVVSGLVGMLYARCFSAVGRLFHHLALPAWLKPALGGLLVGALGLLIPGALHMGYGWVQLGMSRELLDLPLWMVVALPFAKILATSLSIGSGGSGGIFGPGMVIGGMLGASFWRLGYGVLSNLPASPAPFVIVGMMALFGGIAHAPLAVMLMVAEMTGNLSLLAPAMIAVAVSTALVGDTTIYRSQLSNRASSPAHRLRFSFPLLSALQVRDAMGPPGTALRLETPLPEAANLLTSQGSAVVIGEHGAVVGVLTPAALGQIPPTQRPSQTVQALAGSFISPLAPEQTLDTAQEYLVEHGLRWAPVVEGRRQVGGLSGRDVIATYKRALGRGIRRARALPEGTTLLEVPLPSASPLAGRTLQEAGLPRDTLVVAITRDGEAVFPRASTRLEAGDLLMVITTPAGEQALRAIAEGTVPAR